MLKIKQEPTGEEVEKSVKDFEEGLQKCKDLTTLQRLLSQVVQELTPAEKIRLLLPIAGKLADPDGETTLTLDESKGLIREAIDQTEAILTNDVSRDERYDAKVDNPQNYPLKSLLVFPFFRPDRTLLGVLWAAIPLDDLNQFVSRDIEHLQSIVAPLDHCLTQLEKERGDSLDADHSLSLAENSINSKGEPTLIGTIRSWLKNLKKQ